MSRGRAELHWLSLPIGLIGTLWFAWAVHSAMVEAGRSDFAQDCGGFERAVRRQFADSAGEFRLALVHLQDGVEPAGLRRRLSEEAQSLRSVWIETDAGGMEVLWRSAAESACTLPPPIAVDSAGAALQRGELIAAVGSEGCRGCVWLLSRERTAGRLVFGEVDLGEPLAAIGDHMSGFAEGSVALRVGDERSVLLDRGGGERRVERTLVGGGVVPVVGGGAEFEYELRGYATSWSTLRPMVTAGVVVLGGLASVLGFVALRALAASARREERLRQLAEELRARDRDIQRRRAEAEAASAAKSTLLRRTSHNIRSPLTNILGITEAIVARTRHPRQREQLKSIRASARHLLDLANGLLELARAESGYLADQAREVSPSELLAEVVDAFGTRASEKGIGLDLVWESEPPVSVRLFPVRLREVLNNLLDNAIRHTARGGVQLTVGVEPRRLRLEVVDSGEGIEPSLLASLLSEDDGAGGHRSTAGGCGMGVAITRHLVVAMGGEFEITSTVGVGTVVSVRLPLHASRSARGPASAPVGTVQRTSTPAQRATDQPTALVVDDAVEVGRFMRQRLAGAGLSVELARTAREAHAAVAVARTPFALVFLDQQLGDADGLSLLPELRGMTPGAIFVALTGDVGEDAEARYLGAGFDAYLPKPFDAGQLAGILDRVGGWSARRAA